MEPTPAQIWLQPVGSTEEPVNHDWTRDDAHLLAHFWSTPDPKSIQPGDLVVYYATSWQKAIAIVKVLGPPEEVGDGRWKWRVPVCPLVVLGMDRAPDLHDAEIDANRKFKRLPTESYGRLRGLMVESVATV
jgi:hypothetical protein